MNLKLLVDDVQESRARTAGVFPLPDSSDCIDYALTEGGETLKAFRAMCIDAAIVNATNYLDAELRQRRAGDKRNNDRRHTPKSEWGQCGYMICSAVMQTDTSRLDEIDWESVWFDVVSIYDVLEYLCSVQNEATVSDYPEVEALDAWYCFAEHCGWNPADLIRETCADFERKHLGATA